MRTVHPFREIEITPDIRHYGLGEERAIYEQRLETAMKKVRALPLATSAKTAKVGILEEAGENVIGIVLSRPSGNIIPNDLRTSFGQDLHTSCAPDLSKLSSFRFEILPIGNKPTIYVTYDDQRFRIWL